MIQAAPPRIGFIVGPTGAGKTALAVELAERLDAEIVNADSRQVYRGMDIGPAKPSAAECRRVPHHLIGIRSPADPLDVAEFACLAREAIRQIIARGRRVLVVGGSGLYLRALRGGIFRGAPASQEIRARLAELAKERGVSHLHERLREVDPDAARRIGVNDLYRITRALEVFELTGEPISAHQARHAFSDRDYETLTVGLNLDRAELYQSIDRRFDEMIAAGFADEVRALLASGCPHDRPPLASIGYKQIAAHLNDQMLLAEVLEIGKRETQRFANRQQTWIRAHPRSYGLTGAILPSRLRDCSGFLYRCEPGMNPNKITSGVLSRNRNRALRQGRKLLRDNGQPMPSRRRARTERDRTRAAGENPARPANPRLHRGAVRRDSELHGDRRFADDGAIVADLGYFGSTKSPSLDISAARPLPNESGAISVQRNRRGTERRLASSRSRIASASR